MGVVETMTATTMNLFMMMMGVVKDTTAVTAVLATRTQQTKRYAHHHPCVALL